MFIKNGHGEDSDALEVQRFKRFCLKRPAVKCCFRSSAFSTFEESRIDVLSSRFLIKRPWGLPGLDKTAIGFNKAAIALDKSAIGLNQPLDLPALIKRPLGLAGLCQQAKILLATVMANSSF